MTRFFLIANITLLVLFSGSLAKAGFMPYGKIYKAAKDERSYITQAQDSRLQLKLHKALLTDKPSALLDISSYVFQGYAFLIGEVENQKERNTLIEAARSVQGLSGVSFFLPAKKDSPADEDIDVPSGLELKLKTLLNPECPSSTVTMKVIQDKVILLGVVDSEGQQAMIDYLHKTVKNAEIINFMQVPQPEKEKRMRRRPLRNLFN